MTKGTKIGIVIAVIIVVGVGSYFLYKKLNDSSSDGVDENDTSTDEQEPQGTPESTPNVSDSSLEPTPFKTQGQGDYFRLWVNRWYPTDAKKLDLDKTGAIDNKFIRKAWLKYGVLYKQQVKNWNKIKNPIPKSFIDKFGKKDSYNFQITDLGFVLLIPKISGTKIGFVVYDDGNGRWFYDEKGRDDGGDFWDGGKQANNKLVEGAKKQNFKASNFFELAKKLQAEAKKSNFSSFNDDNYGL
jgi:uncharacterized protein YxeA